MPDPRASEAASHWPQITGAPVLYAQRENVVYRVETTHGPHALRLHRPAYHDTATLQSEMALLDHLSRAGVMVPRPLPSRSGALVVPQAQGHASLLSWLEGQPLGHAGRPLVWQGAERSTLFAAMGAEMARLHLLADEWTLPAGFTRPRWDREGFLGEAPVWGRFWEVGTGEDRARLATFRTRALALFKAAPPKDFGLIHADIGNENVLVSGGRVHLIDFDDMGWGWRLFDIATTLFKALDEPDFPALKAALLAGYGRTRPLPDLTLLPLFMALRAVTYLGWIAARADDPATAAKAPAYLARAMGLVGAVGGQ